MNRALAKFDGTTLLPDQEMVIGPECGISCAAQLIAQANENGIKFIQRAQDAVRLAERQQSVAKLQAKIDALS